MRKVIVKKLIFCVLLAAFLTGCAYQDDVSFVRTAMEQLIKGRYSVISRFDWTNLTIMGREVGRQYSQYKKDEEKIGYAQSFIRSFSEGYKSKGATAAVFFGWRMHELKPNIPTARVIAAYCHDKTLLFLFFVSEDKKGERKIYAIEAVRPQAGAQNPAGNRGGVTGEK